MNNNIKQNRIQNALGYLKDQTFEQLTDLLQIHISDKYISMLSKNLASDSIDKFISKNMRSLSNNLQPDTESIEDDSIYLSIMFAYPHLMRTRTPDDITFGTQANEVIDETIVVNSDNKNENNSVSERRASIVDIADKIFDKKYLSSKITRAKHQVEVACGLSLLVGNAGNRTNFIETLINNGELKIDCIRKALALEGITTTNVTIKRTYETLRKLYREEMAMDINHAITNNLESLKMFYKELLKDDQDPELRELCGYALIGLVRELAGEAFETIQNCKSYTAGQSGSPDAETANDIILDFLRIYVADDQEGTSPVEDMAFAISDNMAPYTKAIAGARSICTLLGKDSYGGLSIMASVAIMAYEMMEPDEYNMFFAQVREKMMMLDKNEVDAIREKYSGFSLKTLDYFFNTTSYNPATKYHEAAVIRMSESENADDLIDKAWNCISLFNDDIDSIPAHASILAEFAGVAFKAGMIERSKDAWQKVFKLGYENAMEVVINHKNGQSNQAIVQAVQESAIAFNLVQENDIIDAGN